MRLSIRWIFDHITQAINWQNFNINELVKLLNKSTAEIESVEPFKFDLNKFTIAQVLEHSNSAIKAFSLELNKEFLLPKREDIVIGSFYLVKHHTHVYSWATSADLGSDKCYFIPAIQNRELWKNEFEIDDYILVLDNKAISHRPDLWGHRGFAREIAALMGYDLKPIEQLILNKPVKQSSDNNAYNGPFYMEIKQSGDEISACKRFAGLYISEINNQPSDLLMASRLIRIDSRPIDFIVDATNYVMFDLGQPMHAYDADTIRSKKIVIQSGYGDTLKLLDGTDVILDSKDCAIYDGDKLGIAKPIALAGIIGGASTAVSLKTKSIFIESANFDASVIRHSSMRLKKRTEASTRFEKSLDPNQNVDGILRFLHLLDGYDLCYTSSEMVTSLGARAEEKVIKIHADLIKALLSISIDSEVVAKILTKIGFKVMFDGSIYTITVPTFRSTKDVTIPVDIVEEIGRFIGYDKIDLILPSRVMSAFDFKSVQNLREIKKHLAYGLHMNEVQSYAFFDEQFLRELDYNLGKTLEAINPQSENWSRLITSLIPNLLKVININKHKQERFRYFELNRVWRIASTNLTNTYETNSNYDKLNAVEAFELAGIIGDHKKDIDFYECKNLVDSIFGFFQINVKWHKPKSKDLGFKKLDPWYYNYEAAELTFDNQVIGLAGMGDSRFLSNIMHEGKVFIFELNADFLINSRLEFKKFVPLEKYPEVHIDISMLVPDLVTVHDIEKLIKTMEISVPDTKIIKITLIDFFEKEEWGNKKSLTFRIAIYNAHRTLVKSEIDQIHQDIVIELNKIGGEIR